MGARNRNQGRASVAKYISLARQYPEGVIKTVKAYYQDHPGVSLRAAVEAVERIYYDAGIPIPAQHTPLTQPT